MWGNTWAIISNFSIYFAQGRASRCGKGVIEGKGRLPGWGGCVCISGECSHEGLGKYLVCRFLSIFVLLKFLCYESLCIGGSIFIHLFVIRKVIIHTVLQITIVIAGVIFFPLSSDSY